MADRKISDLEFLNSSSIGDDDVLPIVSASENIVSNKNKKLRVDDLYTYFRGRLEIGTDLLFLSQGFNTTQEGYFNVVHTNRLRGNVNESLITIDDGTDLSVNKVTAVGDLQLVAGSGSKNVTVESTGTGSIVLKNDTITGKIDIQAGEQGLRLFNANAANYVDINLENISGNRRLNLADGNTTLVAGTMVPSTRTLEINTQNGITGGLVSQDLSSSRSWTLGLTGQALALHNLNSNGFIVRTGLGLIVARSIAVSGNGISITNETGAGGNPTISINATDSNTGNAIVSRNSLGNFSAGTITASLSGNASTATALETGRTIQLTGDVTGTSESFNGTQNLSFAATLSSTGVSAGTYTKVTVDTKGRVTTATNIADTDVPSLTSAKISDFDTQVRSSRLDQMAAPTASVSLNNQKLTNVANPTNPSDAATKAYVDAGQQGLIVKDAVVIATTGNIILSGLQTIDGYVLNTDDRVLVKNQTAEEENGIYKAKGGAWVRAEDADDDEEVETGLFVFVELGTVNEASGWVLTSPNPIELDVDPLIFAKFSGAGQIEAGDGLIKTGNTIDINTASSSRIAVTADTIDLATIGTAGTYKSVTVDSYGRVSSGTNPTTLSGYGITDAATSTHTHGNISNAGAIGSNENLPVITGFLGVLTTGSFGSSANTFCEGNDARLSDARTPLAHTHGNITNDGKIGTTASKPIITSTNGLLVAGSFGSSGGTFCEGNDARLSDARTPLSHTHGNITNDGKIGSISTLPIITGANGVLTTGSFGSSSGTFCEGNDARLSNARAPLSHTHGNISNEGAIGLTANLPIITTTSGVLTTGSFGTGSNTFCEGNDSRLSNTRVPTDLSVTDAKVASNAAIAGIKISPNFGNQNIVTSGTLTVSGTTSLGTATATTQSTGDSSNNIATTAFVKNQNYISSASAALTGTPTAPTASTDTNTTQIATTAFVLGQASGTLPLVNGPAAAGSSSRWSRQDHVHPVDTSRAAASHTHGNISNAGAIGTTANLPIITTTSGVLTTGSFGTTVNTFCQGNDSRLTDTRIPTDSSVTDSKVASNAAIAGTKINPNFGTQDITTTGNVLLGSAASVGIFPSGGTGILQLQGSTSGRRLSALSTADSNLGSGIALGHLRNGTNPKALLSGDTIGEIFFQGHDGNGYQTGASIESTLEANSDVNAGSFVIGLQYIITFAGNTSFTSIGSASNAVGTTFTATGAGTGTGRAALVLGRMPGNLVFKTGSTASAATNRVLINTSGQVLVNTTSSLSTLGLDLGAGLQIEGLTEHRRISIASQQNGASGSQLVLAHYRLGSSASPGLRTNDVIGSLEFIGNDGNQFWSGARIESTMEANAELAASEIQPANWYRITSVGTTVFTNIGSSLNTVGTIFLANGSAPGTGTGRVVLVQNVNATALVSGTRYTITGVGTTNFTLGGAASNTIGTTFTYNGTTLTGTGTAATDLARMPADLHFETRDTGGEVTTKAVLTNAGRFGINTTTPNGLFDVGGNTDNNIQAVLARGSDTNFQLQARNASAANTSGSPVSYFGVYNTTNPIAGIEFARGTSTNAGSIRFTTGTTEAFRVTSSNQLLIGATTSLGLSTSSEALVQIETSGIAFAATCNGNNSTGAILAFGKTRGTSSGSTTAVADGDTLGEIRFAGGDGTTRNTIGSSIQSRIEGTVGTGVLPSRLVFSTAGSSGTLSEALRLTNDNVIAYNQAEPVSKTGTTTLAISELKTGILKYTGTSGTLTLPTGTLTQGGFPGIYTNLTFEWSVINTASGNCTIGDGTGHTVDGNRVVSPGTSARFASRRNSNNVFITYRLS
jgi:hypothetical protein